MFSAGLTGYNVTKGLMGALRTRAPRRALVDELLAVEDFQGCLQRLRSMPFLAGVEIGGEPGDLERALLAGCAEFARKIRTFLGGGAGEFIETYMQRYHIHNAKILFKSVLEGSPEGTLDQLYLVSARYDAARLGALKSPEGVVGFFEETRLAAIMREAYEVSEAHDGDISFFELALDRSYIQMLWAAGRGVRFSDGRRLRGEIVLPWLAGTAILWILWLARYRQMAVEEITALLDLPETLMDASLVHEVVETGDPSSVAGDFGNRRLGDFLAGVGGSGDLISLHRALRRFTWGIIEAQAGGRRFDITTLVAALMRWEFIVEDAIIITNAKAVGLSTGEISPLLSTKAA